MQFRFGWAMMCFAGLGLGCSKDPGLVGKWSGQIFDKPATFEFKDDKNVTLTVTDGTIGATYSGTYETTKINLVLSFKKYALQNVDPSVDAVAKQFLDSLIKKPFQTQYHFNKADELAITFQNKTDVLTRDTPRG